MLPKMLCHALRFVRISAAIFCAFWAGIASGAAQADRSSWLNVHDHGVSGSDFQTSAATTAGSNRIVVQDVGDFKVGQGVFVSRCNIQYGAPQVWGSGPANYNSKPSANSVEVRGYDGSAEGWLVYMLDVAPTSPPTFRWSDDLAQTWQPNVPITYDWQPIARGIEVRFLRRDWEAGYTVAFGVHDQLESQIEKIEGNTLTLKDAANRTVGDATVRHSDTVALQAAVDRAIKEKFNVYVPSGHYRLTRGIQVKNAEAIVIEGQNAEDTVLDIGNGKGACFALTGGTEVTIRNFRMAGFMGFDQRKQAGIIITRGAPGGVWGFTMKSCLATATNGTERVLVDNCHASRMSTECFFSHGPSRLTAKPGRPYSVSTTYLRCSVTDCARNAFNDAHCGSENTSVLQCRIVDVGGCAWEGASRFVKFVGNYVRNAGPVAIGNLGPGNRDASYPDLGAGQHIVADNVFEDGICYGLAAICSGLGATQVIVRNNLFINYGSSGVMGSNTTPFKTYPSANMVITGNIFDMTCVGRKPSARTAIKVNHNDVIISDNQIYVRDKCDPTVTGIALGEPALNANVHDNLIRNCGRGIAAEKGVGIVAKVFDSKTFTQTDSHIYCGMPLDRRYPNQCRGWSIAWPGGPKPGEVSILDSFDPETMQIKLRTPHEMKAGDRYEVFPPSANWHIHDNIVTGCKRPVVLDSYGSETSLLKNNLISRGDATGVKHAVEVRGMFRIVGNHISGFDEKDSAAISIVADPLGRAARCVYRDNIFERCSNVVPKSQENLWDASNSKGNATIK